MPQQLTQRQAVAGETAEGYSARTPVDGTVIHYETFAGMQIPVPDVEPCACGPESLARLMRSTEFREGRARVREQLARDLHAMGQTRAADREYQRAKDIREGKE